MVDLFQKETATGAAGDEATTDATSIQGEYTYEDVCRRLNRIDFDDNGLGFQLLTRVFNIIREKNPNVNEGEKIKLTLKPPQVARIGTKRTSFSNFGEICKS